MRIRIVALALALTAVCAGSAQATSIVASGPTGENGGYGLGYSFSNSVNLVIGQAFTMGAQAFIADSVTVWLNDWEGGASGASFTMQLMDAVGPTATAANVLFSGVGAFPDTEGGHSPVTISGLNVALVPSTTYFVVLSSSAGNRSLGFFPTFDSNGDPILDGNGDPVLEEHFSGHGWGTVDGSAGSFSEPFATVGDPYVGLSFGSDGTYNDLNANPTGGRTMFAVDGHQPVVTDASVPEPATGVLAISGLVAIVALKRRVWTRR